MLLMGDGLSKQTLCFEYSNLHGSTDPRLIDDGSKIYML